MLTTGRMQDAPVTFPKPMRRQAFAREGSPVDSRLAPVANRTRRLMRIEVLDFSEAFISRYE
ncbi:hypothetical protein GR183_11460 [Stappia sp. GBMRC 2046]|uniref:Uncharacterized protein n=1 Tax=Stappia sediminis TaxID=2692190 RepID=A0A7X3S887_9HYPH|nr:hypothetical protein [Stappia sediminis]MXN65519.1 hypothetical protein [Stappia sediminis]